MNTGGMTGQIRFWTRVIALNCATAVIPPVIVYAFSEQAPVERMLWLFAYSLVYANIIGSLAQVVMPQIWMWYPNRPEPARVAFRVFALFVLAVTGCMAGGVILALFGWLEWSSYWSEFAVSVKISIFITLFAGGILAIYESMRQKLESTTLQLRTHELERARAIKLATEARLASLESRIHPHFLFNALNSISSLIPDDPERAERLIGDMASLLRFSLDSANGGLVPLEREMKVVEGYLAIEKARFGDRLRYSLDVPSSLEQAAIPPLSVQTLVENSVKYAVSASRTGAEIRISASRDNGLLRVDVRDDGPGFSIDSVPAGHGIDNLQSRLSALFGAGAALEVARQDGWSVVTVSVPA